MTTLKNYLNALIATCSSESKEMFGCYHAYYDFICTCLDFIDDSLVCTPETEMPTESALDDWFDISYVDEEALDAWDKYSTDDEYCDEYYDYSFFVYPRYWENLIKQSIKEAADELKDNIVNPLDFMNEVISKFGKADAEQRKFSEDFFNEFIADYERQNEDYVFCGSYQQRQERQEELWKKAYADAKSKGLTA